MNVDPFTRFKKDWALLTAGLLFDFGVLFLFKYLQFTGAVLSVFLTWAGLPALSLPAFVQPLGVSFYTFTVTGCLIDAYRGGETEARFSEYALFVSFFPAILSGPIVRSRQLLPQLRRHGEPGSGASCQSFSPWAACFRPRARPDERLTKEHVPSGKRCRSQCWLGLPDSSPHWRTGCSRLPCM